MNTTERTNNAKTLQSIAREIKARVAKLDFLGGEAVDHRDSINKLLEDARKLCADDKEFDAFKRKYCPQLGKSRTYELLTIEQGKKTIEQIRADTKRRVAKHRAKENTVTENPSVTDEPVDAVSVNPAKGEAVLKDGTVIGIAGGAYVDVDDAEASADARKAGYAALEATDTPADVDPVAHTLEAADARRELYVAEETAPKSQPAAPEPTEPEIRKITMALPRPAPKTPEELAAELLLLVDEVLGQYTSIEARLVRTELVRLLAEKDAPTSGCGGVTNTSSPFAEIADGISAALSGPPKLKRGRPPGSKNKPKAVEPAAGNGVDTEASAKEMKAKFDEDLTIPEFMRRHPEAGPASS